MSAEKEASAGHRLNTLPKSLRAMVVLTWLIVCGNIIFTSHGDDFDNNSPRLFRDSDPTATTLAENGFQFSTADGIAGNEFLFSGTDNTFPYGYHETSRLLQASTTTPSNTTSPKTPPPAPNQTKIIKESCKVYLTAFAALFIAFLFVRPRCPKVYNFKKSFPDFHVPVADDSFGIISWLWKVLGISDADIREQCGMDALTTIRVLESGVKLSLVGVFNSIFLFPIYSTLGKGSRPKDPMYSLSLSDMGKNNDGVYATTFAAYTLFGAAMYFIAQDFEWFTAHRHAFLSKKCAQNCSVFLSGLPADMQTNKALIRFFHRCFSHDAVAEAHVALNTPALDKKIAERNSLITKLEHAINVLKVKNQQPMHKTKLCKIESVPFWSKEIKDLNDEIESRRQSIESMRKEMEENIVDDDVETRRPKITEKILGTFRGSAKKIKSVVVRKEDGTSLNAAFVTFSDLTSANIVRQTVQHAVPWSVVPVEPPMPDFVNWKNVGISSSSKNIGELLSSVFTVVLCIFWTIPVAFVQSISNVQGLTGLLPFLKEPVENNEWIAEALAVLAPLLLLVFISLLPTILLTFVKFECGIEIETLKHPSLFSKLAIFTIVQTFFISTISSTLFESLQGIIDDPASGITLLSEALPAQAAFFIQLIMVQCLVPLGIELLRITPVVMNLIRKLLAFLMGHNLTEKERNEAFILPALGDPAEYYFGSETGSKLVMLLMVQYVYSCMAPITSYFTLLVFCFHTIGLRNQFIFIYPSMNDSGGKLWLNLQRLSMIYMIIAEIILFVLLLSKVYIAALLLIPLIIMTILFKIHFDRRHYYVTHYLPMKMCSAIDGKNKLEGVIDESFKNAYLQPALRGGPVFPENYRLVEDQFGRTNCAGFDRIETADGISSSDESIKLSSMRGLSKAEDEVVEFSGTESSLSEIEQKHGTSDRGDRQKTSLFSLLFVQMD